MLITECFSSCVKNDFSRRAAYFKQFFAIVGAMEIDHKVLSFPDFPPSIKKTKQKMKEHALHNPENGWYSASPSS